MKKSKAPPVSNDLHEQVASSVSYLESKSIWTLDELCAYSGYGRGTILKLTSAKLIPFYKPSKFLFFDSNEIKQWLKTNPQGETQASIADVFTDKKKQ